MLLTKPRSSIATYGVLLVNIDALLILNQYQCLINTLSVSMSYQYLKVIDLLFQYLIDIVTSAIPYPYRFGFGT